MKQESGTMGEAVGGLAHGFNNLLSVVKGHAYFIGSTLSEDHPLRACIDAIISATEKGADLSAELYSLSQQGSSIRQIA